MIQGLHHITAIADSPQRNFEFYRGILGLRMVKKTVNFDDPGTYHFYYGDETGKPGTILTFFPWPGSRRGRHGTGQATVTSFAIGEESLDFWMERLDRLAISYDGPHKRFEQEYITVFDPDGMRIELIASPLVNITGGAQHSKIPPQHAIQRFHSTTLTLEGFERTADVLTRLLGMRLVAEQGNRYRYAMGEGGAAHQIDLLCLPASQRGSTGAGTIHHIAFRTLDDASQLQWHQKIAAAGLNVSPVMDRNYFHSIYFREPGGVLFEIATDPPGFAVDEPVESLGQQLKLPEWFEPIRPKLETVLPALTQPEER